MSKKDKVRVITRRYFKKKQGIWVEKVYTYTKDYEKRQVIITKTGKLAKHGQKRIDELLENMTLSQRSEAESYIKQAQDNKERLTDLGLISKIAHNKREKMLINAGSDLQDALAELDATELEYFDERNWQGNIFTNTKGDKFKFEFDYNGSLWTKIQ